MSSFQNPDGTGFTESGGGPVRVVAPTTGDTIQMKWSDRSLYVTGTGTIAALKVELPRRPLPGDFFHMATAVSITSLTIADADGTTIVTTGTVTALTPGTGTMMRWLNKTLGWVPWK